MARRCSSKRASAPTPRIGWPTKDIVAVGCDNAAVEVIPFDDNDFLNIHKILLVNCGIYMLEFLNLIEPANDGIYEGMLSVGPLKVTGATGSPINPIFIG